MFWCESFAGSGCLKSGIFGHKRTILSGAFFVQITLPPSPSGVLGQHTQPVFLLKYLWCISIVVHGKA